MAKKLDQFMFIYIFNEADDVVGPGLAKDVFAVSFNGPLADAQLSGNLSVVEFPFYKTDDFQFAKSKGSIFGGGSL